jgi:hypothetical protein
MIAVLHCRRDRLRHQHGAHRETAGEWLRERDHVGLDAHLLVGEQRSGASEPALNLVEDERDVSCLRHSAQLAQEAGVDDANAALPLDRLDDQRGDRVGVERGIELLEIALEDRDPGGEWAERQSVAGSVGRRERAEEPSVERAAQRDGLVLRLAERARPAARVVEGGVVRLPARIGL